MFYFGMGCDPQKYGILLAM